MDRSEMFRKLYELESVKFGDFTLKSGISSPFYIDLRAIIASPALLRTMSLLIAEKLPASDFDLICGVAYTALPMATFLSLHLNKPMVIVRKEAKSYGTKKMVEGVFQAGQRCVVIEDVVTTGSSVLTTINHLQAVELHVPAVVAFLDREQGGKAEIAAAGCDFRSVFTLTEFLAEFKSLKVGN